MKYDYLIVGAGLTGSVLAERLRASDKKVLVIDKCDHIGGNCFDYVDPAGVLVHKYGPHYFRTNYAEVEGYLSRFTGWRPHEYRIRACVNGKLYPLPINRDTLNAFFGKDLKTDEEAREFLDSKKLEIASPKNAEEQVLSQVGRELYDAFFRNYTKKQWGIDPKDLDASVTARIPTRTNTDDRYFNDSFQAMPKDGYAKLFENLLRGIEVRLRTEYKTIKDEVEFGGLIYTGPIDEFFDCRFGPLPYRSLRFEFETCEQEYYQDYSQINYPNDFDYTRIVEIKHATGQKIPRTTIVREYPTAVGDPFYPVPNPKNRELYQRYAEEAKKLKDTYFIGRLAEYRYLNMDQVCKNALDLFENVLSKK